MAIFASFVISFTVLRTFYIHVRTTAFMWYDCQWPWAYFIKVIGLFHIKFLKNGVWYGKSYHRLLIGNHTLAFDWSYFWWPWSTLEGHFSLGCHFHVHFSNPWHAFASHGLPATAELFVFRLVSCGRLSWVRFLNASMLNVCIVSYVRCSVYELKHLGLNHQHTTHAHLIDDGKDIDDVFLLQLLNEDIERYECSRTTNTSTVHVT